MTTFIIKRVTGSSLASAMFEKAMREAGHVVLGPNQEPITMADGSTAIIDWTSVLSSPVNVTLTLGKPTPKKETET